MKKIFVCMFAVAMMMVLLIGCTVKNPRIPVGYRTCATDWDCYQGEHCTFVGVDTYAVCKW
jgi:hypothetical protein